MNRRPLLQVFLVMLIGFVALGWAAQFDVGLGDNGDFTRAMTVFTSKPIGFEVNWPDRNSQRELWERRFFRYYIPWWKLDYPEPLSIERPYKSSAYVLWYPGVIVNRIFYSGTVLNLGVMSLPGRFILLLCFALLMRRLAGGPGGGIVLAVFGVGVSLLLISHYSLYFNSFYFEQAGLVFLFVYFYTFVSTMGHNPVVGGMLSMVPAWLIGSSKAQWVYYPLLVSVLQWVMYRRVGGYPTRRVPALLGIGLIASLSAGWMTRLPDLALENHTYHRLFTGFLSLSADPQAHLTMLGVPDALPCVGVQVFAASGDECKRRVASVLHWRSTLSVLLKEPSLLIKMIKAAADHAHVIKPASFGIFAGSDPRSQAAKNPQGGPYAQELWLRVKGVFPRGWILVVWLLACAIVCYAALRGERPMSELAGIGFLSAVVTPVDMSVAFLGDGFAALNKHLFMANLTCDMATLCTFTIGLLYLVHRLRLQELWGWLRTLSLFKRWGR